MLLNEIDRFLRIRGYWQDLIQYGQIGVKAAEKVKDINSGNWFFRLIGWVYLKRADFEEARRFFEQALALANQAQQLNPMGWGMRYLGQIAREQGNFNEARRLAESALKIAQQIGNEILKNNLYSDFAQLELEEKNFTRAESLVKQAIAGFNNLGQEARSISKLVLLGELLLIQNRLDEAQAVYQEGILISQKYKRQDTFGRAKYGLAKLHEQQENYLEALKLATEAIEIFQKLGMKKYTDEAQALTERLERKLAEFQK